jgi:uncharacterized membrane protein
MPKKVKKSVPRKAESRSVSKKDANSGNSDSKLFAFLGIFLTLIGFLIAYLTKKDDKYVMFYAKQGLVLFIGFAIAGILVKIPFVDIIGGLVGIVTFVFWIIGIFYSFSGEMKEIPLIGKIAKSFNF